ncbi:RNA polymerase sigma factor [Sphingosinicella rhizophila]|uniref:RNA polymerase sigma factor n=1 Tax=Sphingosinicella rhizophila TaxID=3050082 RepID=A0ABU3QC43_9SPHN|nr:RNA polymerase sigma factor [Sphingosinicella sp. GR2756]MDT9600842.1 RNA polymerase sigma factor [Sphingosinicella sp. GR2756]
MTELDLWFVDEILPQERALTRFIRRNWRDEAEVPDLRQEIYARAYKGAKGGRPTYARAYLFTIARNLLIDRTRRAKVIPIDAVADLSGLDVATDLPSADRHLQGRQELQLLRDALAALPPRCREVVTLRKIDRLPQREVARRLSITEDTVERQVGKGMRILAEAVFGHAIRVRRRSPALHDGKARQ